jgi:hypothetical protein
MAAMSDPASGEGSGDTSVSAVPEPARPRFEDLPPAAQRALMEAEERRKAAQAIAQNLSLPREVNGRGGAEPVRYGDWEVKGIASDF